MGLRDIWYQHLYTIKYHTYIGYTLVMNTSGKQKDNIFQNIVTRVCLLKEHAVCERAYWLFDLVDATLRRQVVLRAMRSNHTKGLLILAGCSADLTLISNADRHTDKSSLSLSLGVCVCRGRGGGECIRAYVCARTRTHARARVCVCNFERTKQFHRSI